MGCVYPERVGGHLFLVEKMIELGATNTNIIPIYFPEYGTE